MTRPGPRVLGVLRRVGLAVLQVLGAVTVVFVAVSLLPGDPARALAGGGRPPTAEVRAAVAARFDLDEPLPRRYLTFVGGLVRGDLGESAAQRRPVRDVLVDRVPATLRLGLFAVLIEVLLGATAGVLAVLRRTRWLDMLFLVAVVSSLAIPVYLLAALAQHLFGLRWQVLPVSGVGAGWRSWVLPALVLAAPAAAWVAQLLRISLAEQLDRDHANAARALGFTEARVTRQSLRLAAVPVVSFVALDLAALMGGAVVVESVFNIPGVGREVVEAIRVRDTTTLVAITTLMVVVFVVLNAVADLVNGLLDPRVGRSA